jgi:cytochrome P450
VSTLVPGAVIDIYDWVRHVALRVALRALFGLDPDRIRAGSFDAVDEFEAALSFHARSVAGQVARGPGSPHARVALARRRLDELLTREIDARRAGAAGQDLLSLLVAARDEDGDLLPTDQIRDEVLTLLFAGHDTTTSTMSFLVRELARQPELLDDPGVSVRMLIDETLRMYPPAYIGPRRSIAPFAFDGVPVPGRAHIHYCSWASHHLPDVWPDPSRFDPYRFTPERKAAIEKGAYVPFGGGSRTCIGMRFGEAELDVMIRALYERLRFELLPGHRLRIRTAPTISPIGGLPVRVRAAKPAAFLAGGETGARAPVAA